MKTAFQRFPGHPIAALSLVLALAVGMIAESSLAAGRLYRFTNAQGKVEIAHSIPNDRVKYGYDILDGEGRVIQRIMPELNESQLADKRRKDAELARCQETWRRVTTMYQTEADIDRFEAEEIEALETAIANDRANLLVIRGQHKDLLAQAVRTERSGGVLSSVLMQNIERAAGQIRLLEKSIATRGGERKRIKSRFNQERLAFRRGPC
jgi:hypothetical protein